MKHDSIGWVASRWHSWLHDSRAEMGGLQQAEDQVADAVFVQLSPRLLPEDAPEEDLEVLGESVGQVAGAVGRGLYARLYGNPEAYEGGPAWARSVLEAVQESADLDELRTLCGSDPDMTAIATTTLLREVAERMPDLFDALDESERDPQAEPDEEQDDDAGDEEDGEDQDGEDCDQGDEEGDGPPVLPGGVEPGPVGDEEGEGAGAGVVPDGEGGEEVDAVVQAVAQAMGLAVRQAIRDVAEARAQLDGLLPGLGSSRTTPQNDPRRLQLLERLRKDRQLQQVLRIAGRIRRVADRIRLVPSPDLRIELADVERGADLPQVLPSELVALNREALDDDDAEVLELLALKGLVDRTLLQRRMTGNDRLGRGPMVVLLDASDSMWATLSDGLSRISWAAAVAIATVRAGVEERRSVSICVFDGSVRAREQWEVPVGDLVAAEAAVLGCAAVRPGGGTVFDGPITWGLDHGAERDRADLLLVTDGMAHVSPKVVARLKEARDRGLRLWGVLAGEGGFGGVLEQIADGITEITGAEGEDAVGAVGGLGAT